jgi:hypothetical protein
VDAAAGGRVVMARNYQGATIARSEGRPDTVAEYATGAIGAVGSALPSHGRGHRFESGIAHQKKLKMGTSPPQRLNVQSPHAPHDQDRGGCGCQLQSEALTRPLRKLGKDFIPSSAGLPPLQARSRKTRMKRRDLVKRIATEAKRQGILWELDRNGANHDVYTLDGLSIPIPRHSEIGDRFAIEIFRECEPKLGKGWWK